MRWPAAAICIVALLAAACASARPESARQAAPADETPVAAATVDSLVATIVDEGRRPEDAPTVPPGPTATNSAAIPSPTATPAAPIAFAEAGFPSPTATAVSERAPPTPPTPLPATATPRRPAAVGVPADRAGQPGFSNVAQRTPAEVVAYLAGRLPAYPGVGPAAALDFSPSNILETMDTVVLDAVSSQRGAAALQQVYDTMARAVLATLREQYGDRWVLVPLDAGHGGKRGFFWDSGSEGTEARHTRAVVAAMARLAQTTENARIILRPIYNDDVADDLGMPANLNKPIVNSIMMRQVRASMLASEAAAWNRAHAEAAAQVAVHEISVHFNAGSGGALVLHQGSTVRPEFAAASLDFARRYLRRVTADLNAGGLLPAPLRLWSGDGLHDDVMMYRPAYLSDADIRGITLRYGGLQGGGYLPRYVEGVLANTPWR